MPEPLAAAWPPDDATIRCPFAYFAQLRERAPVHRYPETGPDGVPMFVVTRWAECAEVLLAPDVFVNDLDGVLPAFENNAVPSPEPDTPTFYEDRNVFFADAADPLIKRLSVALSENDNNPAQTPEQVAELQSAWLALLELNAELLHARAREPIAGDYVSDLVAEQIARDGALDPNALAKHLAVTIFGADHAMGGHLADLAARLGRDPALQDRVRADRSLVRPLMLEALRIESPLPWLFRQCVADTTVGGVAIPAGALVLVASVAANHDPAEFPAPATFALDRPNVARNHLTLGRGVHRCAGASMASLQAEVTVNKLLDRLRDIRLDEGRSDLLPELSYGFRVPTAVHLTFTAA